LTLASPAAIAAMLLRASLLAKSGVPIEVFSQRLGQARSQSRSTGYITVYRELGAAEAFDRMVS
jgi:hypothetical protein